MRSMCLNTKGIFLFQVAKHSTPRLLDKTITNLESVGRPELDYHNI